MTFLFEKHIIQSNNRLPFLFSDAKIEIGNYTMLCDYDKKLAECFCYFLKLILSNEKYELLEIIPCTSEYYNPKINYNVIKNLNENGKVLSGIKINISKNIHDSFIINNVKYDKSSYLSIVRYDDNKKINFELTIDKSQAHIKLYCYKYNHDIINNILDEIKKNNIYQKNLCLFIIKFNMTNNY